MVFAGVSNENKKENEMKEKKAKDEFIIDEHTAIVMTDPQNDFLSEEGKGWGLFWDNITKNGTVEHLRQIFDVAAQKDMLVFISPHY
mgnify:FL=1